MPDLSVVVVTVVKEGHVAWLENKLNEVVPIVRTEKGLLSYEVLRDPTEPRRFVTLEKWDSKEAFDAHMASDHITGFFAEADGKIDQGDMYLMDQYL